MAVRAASAGGAATQLRRALRIVSWNVDGLADELDIDLRARAVCAQLLGAAEASAAGGRPDVILLQEVVDSSLRVFRSEMGRGGYQCVCDEVRAHSRCDSRALLSVAGSRAARRRASRRTSQRCSRGAPQSSFSASAARPSPTAT